MYQKGQDLTYTDKEGRHHSVRYLIANPNFRDLDDHPHHYVELTREGVGPLGITRLVSESGLS